MAKNISTSQHLQEIKAILDTKASKSELQQTKKEILQHLDDKISALRETVATKDDLKQYATKNDIQDLKQDIKDLTILVKDIAAEITTRNEFFHEQRRIDRLENHLNLSQITN